MFGKKKNTDGKKNYDLTYENLAIPEIHTHEAEEPVDQEQKETDQKPERGNSGSTYPKEKVKKMERIRNQECDRICK